MQVAADAAQLALGQRGVALGGEANAVAQVLVLVEQHLELRHLLLERNALLIDCVAALADDAEQEQVDDRDATGDREPRLQLRVVNLLVDLVGPLVELGRADDSVALLSWSVAAQWDVHLEQPAEAARALVDVLLVTK